MRTTQASPRYVARWAIGLLLYVAMSSCTGISPQPEPNLGAEADGMTTGSAPRPTIDRELVTAEVLDTGDRNQNEPGEEPLAPPVGVRIVGDIGSVDATQCGTLAIRNTSDPEVEEVIAEVSSNGSFEAEIRASVGDELELVARCLDGDSEPVTVTVTASPNHGEGD